MQTRRLQKFKLLCGVALYALAVNSLAPAAKAAGDSASNDGNTATPVKHVIVIIGENRTFDHIFATYKPKKGESVWNLLSQGIVNSDGSPGRNYYTLSAQFSSTVREQYLISPPRKVPYRTLPTPLAGGPQSNSDTSAPFNTLAQAKNAQIGLPDDYYVALTTGATGLTRGTPDTRITYAGQPVTSLPPGPFQLTPGVPYDAYANSPVHRFYQMRQQLDCNGSTGCLDDLFAWVEVSIGAGNNGKPQPADFSEATTGEGGTALGFYNVQQGDSPYFKSLANTYSMSDNFHQSVMGGTGANHIMLGYGDLIWFSDTNGNPAKPPHNQLVAQGTANEGVVDQIENPNPQPNTNNWYIQDGYGGGSSGMASYGGGSYTMCFPTGQPGVRPIANYLQSLSRPVNPKCEPQRYYLLNNYNPGYFGDGSNAYTDTNDNNTVFTIPPSTVRNIGDVLLQNDVSWRYYGDQWNRYVPDPYYLNPLNNYCNICNFFQYSTAIMTNATVRTEHLKDTSDLYNDITSGTLPAVSFVKPSGFVDGHPASSKLNLFEGFSKYIVDLVQSQPSLWADTAILITFDEGGGYYDSGYVQALDFFGDGTRIPMIAVSPYAKPGHISHSYADHVSVLKFIETNWKLPTITGRSRDNLPNPKTAKSNPYVPTNSPAIGDLTDLFQFH
jgi:phospholipase C